MGCFSIAWESDEPFSTSAFTSRMISEKARLGVCSARMLSDRRRESPELIMVANWRLKIATSFAFTRPDSPGILISFWSAEAAFWSTWMGMKPRSRSALAAADDDAACISPSWMLPSLSLTR